MTQDDFRKWLSARVLDEQKPVRTIIDIEEIHGYIPPLLATTPDGFRVIQAHNRKTGVWS